MITGLPQDFIDQVDAKSRKPIQLAEFYTPSGTFYLSDISVGQGQGLDNDFQPWIESWGTLKDNTNLTNVFEGNSIEIRSVTINILVSPVSKTFIKTLFQTGVENTVVKLYQWFEGITSPPELIDVMVCQDPIKHSESSMSLTIDLVSTLMKTDPHLWPQEEGIENQPIVVGKALGMPLKDLQTARKTAIADDMTFDYLGSVFIDNGVGFPASGVVSIDSEDMTYDWISASAINITARAQNGTTARPHLRGALVCPYGAIYDYAICSGPVQLIDNLLANSETYLNDVTFFPGQNPVIARFTGRPPWLKVEPGAGGDPIVPDPETSIQYGIDALSTYGGGAFAPINGGAINAASGAATLYISSVIGGGGGWLYGVSPGGADQFNLTSSPSSNHDKLGWSISDKNSIFLYGVYSTDDNVYGYADHVFAKDYSSYGNVISVIVEINAGTCTCRKGIDSKLSVVFVNRYGSRTVLYTETILNYGTSNSTLFDISGESREYDISSLINTFEDLELSRIRFEMTNIRSDDTETTSYASTTFFQTKWDVEYFTPVVTVPTPWQQLLSDFNRIELHVIGSLTSVKCNLRFSSTLSNAEVNQSIVLNGSSVWSRTISSSSGAIVVEIDTGLSTFAELEEAEIGLYQQIVGPDTEGSARTVSTSFEYVEWEITFQPGDIETPDEERVVYAETITVDVTSTLGVDPTPAEVVRHMIEDHSGAGEFIDGADFDTAHANYDAASYYLNGVLDAGTKLHAALKQALMEGMCRLLFNQGKIKLISYFEQEDPELDFEVITDDIQIRSRRTENQPTSLVKNDITIMYDKNYEHNFYDGKINEVDDESVALFFRKDHRRELNLVNSSSVAQLHADRLLSLLATPTSVYSFNMFMKAYTLEKGDRISVRTFLDPRFVSVGNILSVERNFGKGKSQQINLFNIKIANPDTFANLDLEETIVVDDSAHVILKGLILQDTILADDSAYVYLKEHTFSNERLEIVEQLGLEKCQVNGYGTCGYGVHPYGK